MATPLSGTGTPAPGALPQDTSGGSNLLAFKDALSQVGQLARGERTKLMGGFMAPFSGTVKASDFNQLSQSLGSSSDTTFQDYVKNRIAPEYKPPTVSKHTNDAGVVTGINDLTGEVLWKTAPGVGNVQGDGGIPSGNIVSGDLVISGTDYQQGMSALEASKYQGAEADKTYVDPNLYLTMYKHWVGRGGKIADFFRYYPLSLTNPDNAWLAEAITNVNQEDSIGTPSFVPK